MTVKELIDVSPSCDLVEVTVRENGCGKWIQGYRVGKDAKLFPVNLTKEVREKYHLQSYQSKTIPLEEGDEIDCINGWDLKMKVICRDVRRLPDNVANLQVSHVQPRHIPSFHREALTNNEFAYDIDCFPDGYVPEIEQPKEKSLQMDGQMTFDEWMEDLDEQINNFQ